MIVTYAEQVILSVYKYNLEKPITYIFDSKEEAEEFGKKINDNTVEYMLIEG